MLTFHDTMDENSRDVKRDNKIIGYILVGDKSGFYNLTDERFLPLNELQEIVEHIKECRNK